MREEAFFFQNGGAQLFGILHWPDRRRDLGFVFCHPFGEEKLWTHRVFVTFARELARRGYPVLRFDYMGNGDSSGGFEESSVSTALSDIACGADTLRARTGVGGVGLLGLRLGGTLASQVARQRDDVKLLVLWAPIVDGNRYMQELLRTNLTTQMAVYREIRVDRADLVEAMRRGGTANVDGYEVSHAMFEEASGLRMTADDEGFAGPCLAVQVDRAAPKPSPELRSFVSRCPQGSFAQVQEEPFWTEIDRFYDRAPNLFQATLDWLAGVEAELPATV